MAKEPSDSLLRYAYKRLVIEKMNFYQSPSDESSGAHVEEKLILASAKGFSTAASGMKYLKATDTFFNRWPVPLVPVGALRTCRIKEYDAMFSSDA